MFLILSLIVGVACSLITIRTLTSYTEMRAVWKGVIAVLTAVGWFAPFIIAIVRRYGWLSGGAYVMFTQIAYFLFGLGFILFCLLIFRDAQWFAGYHLARWAGRPVEGFDPMNPVLLKKANIAVCVLSFLVAFYALYEGVKLPAVRRVNIDTPKVERPVKIAVLSDLHINAATSPARVRKIVERVNALEPDIIVLPGDIIDDGPKALEKQMDALVKLKAKEVFSLRWAIMNFMSARCFGKRSSAAAVFIIWQIMRGCWTVPMFTSRESPTRGCCRWTT